MAINLPHEWLYPPSLTAAAKLQRELAEQVVTTDAFAKVDYLGGMDVSNNPYDPSKQVYACVVVLNEQGTALVETANSVIRQEMPYVPGFLGFREAPALVQAFQQLTQKPDLIFVDGHGVSHPRGLGIASHIGVLLDIPTIGVAKTILVGKPETELALAVGAQTPLLWRGKVLAMLVRSKLRCKPLIISSGHRVSLPTAVTLVQRYLHGYRLPEPTRQAHLAANALRRITGEQTASL